MDVEDSHRGSVLADLVELSRWLGAPEQDCTILGEGNTSARVSDETFLVKASGGELGVIGPEGFIEIRRPEILAMMTGDAVPDDQVRERLAAAKADPAAAGAPSVETPLHAVCLGLPGVNFVGHSHPTAINAITCSNRFEETLALRLFPDQIVVCGPRSLQLPYIDPGVELGGRLQAALDEYLDRWGEAPKTIYLQNHGFVALGASPRQVKAITLMAIKSARILAGTAAFGGPQGLTDADIDRIHNRPDEKHRQRIIDQG